MWYKPRLEVVMQKETERSKCSSPKTNKPTNQEITIIILTPSQVPARITPKKTLHTIHNFSNYPYRTRREKTRTTPYHPQS